MSKIKLTGNASGTGTLTIAAPNTNTDRTLTLPDADITLGGGVDGVDSDYTSGTAVKIDSSGNVGIGKTNPTAKLSLGDSITNKKLAIYEDALGESYGFGIAGGEMRQFAANGNNLSFGVHANSTDTYTEYMRIDSSANLKFNSGYGSVATAYGCRVWCNYNGTTNAINGSGNVSSITDYGAGNQGVNFSSSMPDAVYATVIGGARNTGTYEAAFMSHSYGETTTRVQVLTAKSDQTMTDHSRINIAVFR